MLMIYFGASDTEAARVVALIMAGANVIGYAIGEGIADGSGKGGVRPDARASRHDGFRSL